MYAFCSQEPEDSRQITHTPYALLCLFSPKDRKILKPYQEVTNPFGINKHPSILKAHLSGIVPLVAVVSVCWR